MKTITKRLINIISLAAWISFSFSSSAPTADIAYAQNIPQTRQVTLTSDGLIVSWTAGQPGFKTQTDGTSLVSLDGYAQSAEPGQPLLPEDASLVAIPPGGTMNFVSQAKSVESLPVPAAGIALDHSQVVGKEVVPSNGSGPANLKQAASPATLQPMVTLEDVGVVRGIHLARLTFRPVGYGDNSLTVTHQAQAVIHFGVQLAAKVTTQNDLLQREVAAQVINPAQVETSSPGKSIASGTPNIINRAGQAIISVTSTGLTALSYETLKTAGFPVDTANPGLIHLQRDGSEIPMQWVGNTDSVFGTDEQLLFYAQPRFSRWSNQDAYYLSIGLTPGERMQNESAAPVNGAAHSNLWVSQVFEKNLLYTPDCICAPIPAGRDGDRWVWDELRAPDHLTNTYTFTLAGVDPAQASSITLWLIGNTEYPATPNHRIDVKVNNVEVGLVEFNGKTADQALLTIPANTLIEGSNNLTLTLPGIDGVTVEGVWLDAFQVNYARGSTPLNPAQVVSGASNVSQYSLPVSSTSGLQGYDITTPDSPLILTNLSATATQVGFGDPAGSLPKTYAFIPTGAVQSPTAIRMVQPLQNTTGADYLILSPASFIPYLNPLVDLRRKDGFKVAVEDVQAIYDAYDGQMSPEAIKAYLQNAYSTWNPKPAFVLLMGGGTSDPKKYLSSSADTYLPAYLAVVDPYMGETAADNQFVTLDGADNLPDMAIGRLPANSAGEAQIMLLKVVQYETIPYPGIANRSMLFVADNPDDAGNFPYESNTLADRYLGGPYIQNRLDYNATTKSADFKTQVINAWNQGSGVIIYTGHSSNQQWGEENFFHLTDVYGLQKTNNYPVLLEMTCLTGSFQMPYLPSLDATLLKKSGRGVVAVWGSTGLGLTAGHMLLAQGFLDYINKNGSSWVGVAAIDGKLNLVAHTSGHDDMIDTFNLLGDPATSRQIHFGVYLPRLAH